MLLIKLAVIAATLLPQALADSANATETFDFGPRLCDTTVVPDEVAYDTDDVFTTEAAAKIKVQVYAHVVTGQNKKGRYSRDQIQRQINVMNGAYGKYGISFALQSIDFTVNDEYAKGKPDTFMPAKRKLRKGSYRDLNLYFVSNLYKNLLGYCYFPTGNAPRGSDNFIRDGCVILADTIPGGSASPYNFGGTATHETGHWFGLLHVFQDENCASRGDLVGDTPRQKTATRGCPSGKDSCPGRSGLDSIHNYSQSSVSRS